MSEETTTPDLEDAVRRAVEAFDRGDWGAGLAPYTPDAVWDNSPIGGEVFEGREAIRGFFEDWRGSYEDYEQVVEEVRDLGNGVTFAVIFHRARPRDSSGVVTFRYGAVGIWRDGLAERFTIYTDIDQARAAAERIAEERG
jgi:ketosteroid isomerase-like protein